MCLCVSGCTTDEAHAIAGFVYGIHDETYSDAMGNTALFTAPPNAIVGPLGLIQLADDECLRPEGNGQSFVDKVACKAMARLSMEGNQAPSGTGADHGRKSIRVEGNNIKHCDRPSDLRKSDTWPVYADEATLDRSEPGYFIHHYTGDCWGAWYFLVIAEVGRPR